MQRILKICQQSSSGGDLLEEELVNSGASEIAIYLRTSFHRNGVNRLHARSTLISMNKPALLKPESFGQWWSLVAWTTFKRLNMTVHGFNNSVHKIKTCLLTGRCGSLILHYPHTKWYSEKCNRMTTASAANKIHGFTIYSLEL